VDSPLEPLHLDAHGALSTPSFPHAGWYADGPAPGDVGPAVLAGHVDSKSGPAVFYRLGDLRPGDIVRVQRSGRWLTFKVVDVRRYPKDAFPTADVYGPTPDPQLRLITCSGEFDDARHSYRDNTVVYAAGT
jgi:LPXTG-site transpeptidase (sortase) family protein